MSRILAALASLFSRWSAAVTRRITRARVNVHVAKGRIALKLRRLAARLESRKSESTVMAEYSKIERLPDDKPPTLRKPDPNAPHAELINRVRLYAQHGAKALGPLLDVAFTAEQPALGERIGAVLRECQMDARAETIMRDEALSDERSWKPEAIRAIHAAYNSPWTVKDGEVWEVET